LYLAGAGEQGQMCLDVMGLSLIQQKGVLSFARAKIDQRVPF